MESNGKTELTSKIETDSDREQMTAKDGERLGVEGLSKKEKGLMDTDNSVVSASGRRDYKRYKW